MVISRKTNRGIYVIALIFILFIFVIGLLIGLLVNSERKSFLDSESKVTRLNYDSLQLQYLYLITLLKKDQDCKSATTLLEKQINDLNVLGSKLENFAKDNFANAEEFNLIKREYILAEIKYWFFITNLKQTCNYDTVTLLYFYSNNNCDNCRTQGLIISKLKDDLKDNLLVFSLDYDFIEEPLINIIKNKYDIKNLPTLIINDKKHENLITYNDLIRIVCSKYNNKVEFCIKNER